MKFILLLLLPLWLFASSQPTVLFLNAFHFSKVKLNHITKACEKNGINLKYKSLRNIKENNTTIFNNYDFVILNAISNGQSKKIFLPYLKALKKSKTKFITLKVLDKKSKFRTDVTYKQHKQIADYLENGGVDNLSGFADFLASDIFKISDKTASSPIIYPKTAIYHPKSKDKMFSSLKEYFSFLDVNVTDKPIVALSIYRDAIASIDTELIDAMIDRFTKLGVVPVAFYFEKSKEEVPYKKILSLNDKFMPNALVNFKVMHSPTQRRKEYEALNIPIFGALIYRNGDKGAYEEDKNGVNIMSMPFYLSIPEKAGVINPMIIGCVDKQSHQKRVIDYQLDSFTARVANHIKLQTKPNSQKKLAFFFWNYPSGQNAMGASFLNVPQSLSSMFTHLTQKGYKSNEVNASFFTDRVKDMMALYYRDVNATQLVQRNLCELFPLEDYEKWFNALPQNIQDEINKVWGKATESNMLINKDGKLYFTIPRMKVGNFITLPQGTRAKDSKDEKSNYHNQSVPVSHGYLAVYLYVKQAFGADAIVHLGTHGSQEWMKGKDRGLSAYDSPNLAVGDVPVIYPFIVDDIGEAMQTKRRGSAVSLSHMTPPFAPAGLHNELVDFHELMHEYHEMTAGSTREKVKKQLIELSIKLKFDKEIDAKSDDFEPYLKALHDYLDELASENQPLGLHSFGEAPSKNYTILTIMQMLGKSYTKEAYKGEGKFHMGNYEDWNTSLPYKYIKETIEGKIPDKEGLKVHLETAKKYYDGIVGIKELSNLSLALDGGYISTSTGGDPIRNPDVLPTGRNMYGFDPSKIPTKAAYESGKELTTQLIANYYLKHGVYPDKLAFSLWSLETMRHYGVLEGQILYALGVKPVWNKGGRVIDIEIIPYSKLKRPRVDVVISATGLYRDAFPNIMEYLDKAIQKVVALKEENNFVRSHTKELEKELLDSGMDKEKAVQLSSIRIFSNASGTYGTGLAKKVLASGSWEDDSGMSDDYLGRMGFAFGNGIWGEKVSQDLYKKVLKGTDAAMFSRSSNVYGLLTSDDPFQYLGGIALAVRNIDGKTPELYISNLRNKDKGKVEDIKHFMNKELRTRYFHPQWIKAMQEEGFSGASEILATIENAWGWEVMDPETLRDDQWQEFVEVYVNDKLKLNMKEFFEKHNPDALAQISERFLEAIRKGYFKTDEETIKKLVETYMEMANKHNVYTDNDKFKEYVKGKAIGFGLSASLPSKVQTEFKTTPVVPKSAEPKVKGQELKETKQENVKEDYRYLYFVMFLLFIIFAGMIYEVYKSTIIELKKQ